MAGIICTVSMLRKSFKRLGFISYILIISSIIFFMSFRALGVWAVVSRRTGRHGLFFLDVVHNDAIVIGILLLLLYFGFFSALFHRLRCLAYILRIVVIGTTLFYAVDALLLVNIYRRLHLHDLVKYGLEVENGLTLLAPLKAIFFDFLPTEVIGIILAVIFFSFVLSFLLFQFPPCHPKKHPRLLLVCGICLMLLSCIPMNHTCLHGWAYENLFAYNMPKGIDKHYSDGFIRALKEKQERKPDICEGLGQCPNIILLIVESLSSCHSRFFSGINDYTPHLDAIAKENTSFTNFFANGFDTEKGLIALLMGKVPLPGVRLGNYIAFQGFYQKDSLATLLKEAGYETHFTTTGDLSFTNKRAWLSHIGFDVIEGHEVPYFEGWPRYAFNAAPDEALYAYTIEKIVKLSRMKQPYFMVLETVSSHLPYVDPDGFSNTEKKVFTYVDRQIGHFYEKLNNLGFFGDGMLIIVSDHRVMAPLSKAESDVFGDSAFARIPLIVVGGNKKSRKSEMYFQQVDLFSSIIGIVAKQYQKDEWHGNLLGENLSPPFCILKPMANDRDLIYFRCGIIEEGYIELRGDKTRLLSGQISPRKLQKIIDKINRNRIFRNKK